MTTYNDVMAGPSGSSSFIPKRGTQKRKRKVRNSNVYVLTIVSYVILFATLVASAGVYVYGQFINGQLQQEIAEMNAAVSNFKEGDMQRVQEFDTRLSQAAQRLNNSVSVASIFSAIESATIDTVRFDTFSLVRDQDDGFVITAVLETDTFDSTIFQRGIFERNDVVTDIEIDRMQLNEVINESGLSLGQSISFIANLAIPLEAVPYQAQAVAVPEPTSQPLPEPVVEEPVAEEVVEDNQTDV